MSDRYKEKSKGTRKWIRLRGAPNDPQSFELACWNGLAWEIPTKTCEGRIIRLLIPDYMVAETLPEDLDPEKLFYPEQ
ncbi:MAG: hypothetical protein RMM17_03570 [Acidobacteriota bacterium]|nr:hypothetical protein [Blastocatellia bacterium]MDW8411747.1 hypothetical protein [Acidobacteriota bacterium]